MQHAKRSTTQANIAKIKADIAAVDTESHLLTARIDVRRVLQLLVFALNGLSHVIRV
jgi:hypothetical protein